MAQNGVPSNGHVEGQGSGFPDYRRNIMMQHVKQGYTLFFRHALTLLLVPVAALLAIELATMLQSGKLKAIWDGAVATDVQFNLMTFMATSALLLLVALSYVLLQRRPVYLLDFAVFKPPEHWKCDMETFMSGSRACKKFGPAALEFQDRIIERSGLGQETYLPPAVHSRPPQINMENARIEARTVMFGAVEAALKKTGLKPQQIGVLVVNCSLFNPTPSLAAMLMNHFKMQASTISYNLAGMGCSAGVIAVDLARQMLQLHPNTYALVVSTENITQNWYFGNQRSMLIPNCLFRVGGAAIVLSNHRSSWLRAKYELRHTVRTTAAADDDAYMCIYQKEDAEGEKGVKLEKTLMAVAGNALKMNITTLGPLVLPFSEQLLFFVNLVMRKVLKMKLKSYIPDFKLAFDHFCIHTGGRAVIEEIEKQLALTPHLVQPSKQTLYRYGNISSSSIWYILAYIETERGVKRGDRVWQIGFGSGFKCNSAVWRSLRSFQDRHSAWVEED